MDSLKKLLSLELIGWILIALASFSIIGFGLKAGILLILFSKICKSLDWNCKFCKDKCKK
jgi:hypothetical protein|tara:strand:- start:679 stop:858 length:180 start_codon:yes stop_codon:yes gene_type:complete